MSDSESDNAFESADEGEDTLNVQNEQPTSNKNIVSQEKPQPANIDSCTTEEGESTPALHNHPNNNYCGDILTANDKDQHELTETKNVENNRTTKKIVSTPLLTTDVKETVIHDAPEEQITSQQQRVVLRLEKKLQEKVQRNTEQKTILDDSPTEKAQQTSKSSWKLGGWGSSFISTAASSVSTFTSQVSQGLGTVLETVEATLGAPPPEELAASSVNRPDASNETGKVNNKSSEVSSEQDPLSQTSVVDDSSGSGGGLLSGVSSVTKVLETTGSKVIHGGLDTLELIGKKTFDILTEGDPGLRKKRSIFTAGGASLSQILQEAKEKPEVPQDFRTDDAQKTADYKKFFDDFQGLIHLEALEMLSGESQSKLHGKLLSSPEPLVVKDRLDKIRQTCEELVPEDDTPDEERDQDFPSLLLEHVSALHLPLNIGKLKEVQQNARDWLQECKISQDDREIKDPQELHTQALSTLAEFTSKSIEQLHKIAELMLVKESKDFDPETMALHLAGLATVLCTEVSILSTRFCQCLSTAADDSEDPDAVTPLITNVYLEASNSNTYIQDAFLWLIPILQLVVVQSL